MPRVVGRSSEKLHISAITITLAGAAWHNMTPAFWPFQIPFIRTAGGITWREFILLFQRLKIIFSVWYVRWGNKTKFSLKFLSSTFRTNFSYAGEIWSGGGITPDNFMVNSSPPSCLPSFLGQSIRSGFCPILLCPEKSLRVSWPGSLPRQFLSHLPFYFFFFTKATTIYEFAPLF